MRKEKKLPITCDIQVRNLSATEFDERDRLVMRCAYDSQNALGRLCDERVYENDVARRLRASGFRNVHTQLPVLVEHDGFAKVYRIDLLGDDALYELKTANGFVAEHAAQLLNYSMLLNIHHGKLLNFRNAKVEGKLIVNAVMTEQRHEVEFDEVDWMALDKNCDALMSQMKALLDDWGSFLELRLYEAALVAFFGGEERAHRRCPLILDGLELGTHLFRFHSENASFMVTGYRHPDEQRTHIQRLLSACDLRYFQWINLHHGKIKFITIRR